MRDGFHDEYHDERFFEDDFDDDAHRVPPKPPEGPWAGRIRRTRQALSRTARTLRGLIPYAWDIASLAAFVGLVAALTWFLVLKPSAPDLPVSWPSSMLATQEIEVPAPAGWPELPVVVQRSYADEAIGPRAPAPPIQTPATIPAPRDWPALPIYPVLTALPNRLTPPPAFERFADQPTDGAKAQAYEVVAGPDRPLDRLGRWVGAPTHSLKVTSNAWGETRILPLAFFTVGADGNVSDAMPSILEWFWLACASLLAWGTGTALAWFASHAEWPDGLPFAGFESDAGRRWGSLASLAVAAWHAERTGNVLEALVIGAAIASLWAGRATRARWQALALGIGAAWLSLTTPILDPIPALSAEYGALGVRAWDMLALAGIAVVGIGAAIPWRGRTTHVTVNERAGPLVQDVRVVGQR